MDEQVSPLERDLCLSVLLPGGVERSATVHGSKPVMDLLVTLCASYHLNPSDYTVEFFSPNKNHISFKPNSPIGSLEAEKVVLKPKGVEEKMRRPYMPEASVRLLINYNKSHKAVVRVSPRMPLETLLPVVCDKCEFQVETTVLLRDPQSTELLDMSKTLNEHGLREVYAKDTAERPQPVRTPETAVTPTQVISPPPLQDVPKREKKQKENLGFLSLFRRRKKKPEKEGAASPPASPGPNKHVGVTTNSQDVFSSNTLPADMPKKRRAPLPPMGASQSVPNNLSTCHLRGAQRSAESTLRSTKRRAPPPPCANSQQELQADPEVQAAVDSLNTVEELRENDESNSVNMSLSSSSSLHPSQPLPSSSSSRPSFAHLHEIADDARCALAKVLTSSVSKGALVKRLRNSATFHKLNNGSSCVSVNPGCSDDEVFCAEPEPVLTSDLPTESEWQDPAQRKGTTTFKVVPSKKQESHDPELRLDVPDQIIVEENPQIAGWSQTESEEDPSSPDRSKTETSLQSPEPASQEIQASDRPASISPVLDSNSQDCPGSPQSEVGDTVEKHEEKDEPEVTSEVIPETLWDCSDEELPNDGQIRSEDQRESPRSSSPQSVSADVDHCGSNTKETEAEEAVQEDEAEGEKEEEEGFPPPPSPVFFNEDTEAAEEVREDAAASSQPPSPSSSGPTNTVCEDTEPASASPEQLAAAPTHVDKLSTPPSRFAQAVALAVQRSRLQRHAKALVPQDASSPGTLPSPARTISQFGA